MAGVIPRTTALAAPLVLLTLTLALVFAPAGAARVADWPDNSYVVRVEGLACPYCAYGIEKQFAKRPGVQGTTVDIDAGVVIVTVEPGTRLSDEALRAAVDAAGFSLGGIVHRAQGQ